MEEVILNNDKYELIHNKDGTDMLRQYDPEFKMWIELCYNPNAGTKNFEKTKEILINNYIERVTKNR